MISYNSFLRIFSIIQSFSLLAYWPNSALAEKLNAQISFIEIQSHENDTTITHRQPNRINATIFDEHRVEEWSARRADRPDQRSLTFESVLGARTQVQRIVVVWRFEGRNILVRQAEFPSFYQKIKLIYWSNKCDATVEYVLKAGSSKFGMWALSNGKPTDYRLVYAEDVSCKIEEDSIS